MRLLCLLLLWLGLAQVHAAEPASDLGKRWLVYGQGLAAQGRTEEAVQALDKALAMEPGLAAAYTARGQVLWKLGRRDPALADLRRSLQLDPSQAALERWLKEQEPAAAEDGRLEALAEAQAALDSRDLATALQLFQAGAQARPQEAEWPRGEAESLYALGRFEESRAALARARALAPQDEGLLRLEQAYFHADLAADQGGGSPWGALLRSAVLPGWGQAYNGQRGKAFTVGAVTLGLLAATVATYVAADQAIERYRGLGPGASAADFDAAFGQADGLALANQALGIGFYAAYTWNLLDAAAQARPSAPTAAQAGRVTLLALRY